MKGYGIFFLSQMTFLLTFEYDLGFFTFDHFSCCQCSCLLIDIQLYLLYSVTFLYPLSILKRHVQLSVAT